MPDEEELSSAELRASLPVDSDVEVDDVTPAAAPQPVHLRPAYVGIVALGGALGTGARELLSLAIPAIGAFPMAIFVINLTGAFALGIALEVLLRLGPDEGHRRRLRLFVGTGFLGGYTTYSTLAVGTAQAITGGQAAIGILYALLSVIAGAAAAFAGIAVAAAGHRRRLALRAARR
ncbi:fluoride efflux transporter FluC [Lysinimonas soli]|uniref:Fluoride-specific ion channel FluC n=1 Tax=Lysinimonas soli TaxID=1074233 RepID=A0ABW0NPI8_9MICO